METRNRVETKEEMLQQNFAIALTYFNAENIRSSIGLRLTTSLSKINDDD